MPKIALLCMVTLCGGTLAAADGTEYRANFVEQAAAALAAGRELAAAELLAQHVALHPEEFIVRAQLAELWYRLNQLTQAHLHFTLFLRQAEGQPDLAFRYRIHAHSRLVDISEKLGLTFDEHLHRGLGLWLLAVRRAEEGTTTRGLSVEELLMRAAKQLQAARKERPEDAKVHLVLYRIWRTLNQPAAAARALALADRWAATSPLTAAERQELSEALLRADRERLR